jgi:GT2 family glycosyltransferase
MNSFRQLIRNLTPAPLRASFSRLRIRWFSRNLPSKQKVQLTDAERRASAQFSVIVPVHNGLHVTARCLSSLKEFAGNAEVVIVDDGSTEEAVRQLVQAAAQQNDWKLIRNEKPRGHSRASEAGVSASTRPFFCLLNSDALVTARSWEKVADAFASSESIAVVGPSTSYTYGPQVVTPAYYCRHAWSDDQIYQFAERYVASHRNDPLEDRPFVGGFGFYVRRTTWEALKGFDQNLPDYGNELELCQRILAQGFRVVWCKGAYVHHLGNESYGKTIGKAQIAQKSQEAESYIRQKFGC